MATRNNPTTKARAKSAAVPSVEPDHRITESSRKLVQAFEIIELAIHAIGDEDNGDKPAIKFALRGAAEIVFTCIEDLDSVSFPGIQDEVVHG